MRDEPDVKISALGIAIISNPPIDVHGVILPASVHSEKLLRIGGEIWSNPDYRFGFTELDFGGSDES